MKPFKFMWSHKATKIWCIIAPIIAVLLIVINIGLLCVPFFTNTLNIVFGGRRAITASGDAVPLYEAEYSNKKDALAAANGLVEEICEDGFILLKNEDNVLPLNEGAQVSVFGKNSVNLVYGGSGSSGSTNKTQKTLYDSLEAAGFSVNPTLKAFYGNNSKSGSGRGANPEMGEIIAGFAVGETPVSKYDASVESSYASYNDAAIVVISRIGGEGFDLPRTMKSDYSDSATKIDGARSMEDHYLQLDQNETDLLAYVCSRFEKVVVVINSSTSMELGFLDDPTHYAYHSNILGAVWIGHPGNNGIMALGRLLDGEKTFSGHTVDTYVRDFTKDPSYQNFGNYNVEEGNRYIIEGKYSSQKFYFVDYDEGIYMGYRYWETRGFTDGDEWYDNHIVYPFGYGLSYTTFSWEFENESEIADTALTADGQITLKVKVTNTGKTYSGKEVVQLYVTAPYTNGGIEKAHVVLSDFVKTDLLAPGESQTVEIVFDPYTAASYDYNDANGNGFKGYELEAGEYQLKLCSNAHTIVDTTTVKVENTIRYDETTENNASNLFDDVSAFFDSENGVTTLSRTDWEGTFPTGRTQEEKTIDSDYVAKNLAAIRNDDGKWYTDEMPTTGKEITVDFSKLVGLDYNDELWDEFLDQMTLENMAKLVGTGAFETIPIQELGVPGTYNEDGASGFTNFMAADSASAVYDTCFYQSECVLGASWNKELAEKMGEMIGNEALIGNERGDGLPYSGWYAPSVNLHRSQFGGRNWEYYSEDGILSAQMAAGVIKGAKSKGVVTYIKHFAINDQETCRDQNGYCTWVTEQAMREIYFKPFEYAVKEANTLGVMSSFNRLGTVWTGGSYALLTELLRGEWGFEGCVITDYALNGYLNVEQMIRAGGDIMLNQGGKIPAHDSNVSATQVACLRRASKNILYAVANSNITNMNIVGYRLPIWQEFLIYADIVIGVGCLIWLGIVVNQAIREDKNKKDQRNPAHR